MMATENNASPECSWNMDKIREKVRSYIERHQYKTALFWADKIVSLSGGDAQDLYWYAQCLYLTAQYHRAAHLIRLHQLDKKHLACRYLAAKCHYECHEYQESLDILDQTDIVPRSSLAPNDSSLSAAIPAEKIESSINLLRGKVYEAMDNRALAAECFRQALQSDIWCFEAFNNLVHHHMLSAQEERELLDSLQFSAQCAADEVDLLRFLYCNSLKKYDKPSDLVVPNNLEKLSDNLDVTVTLAERHYYNCDFRQCFKLTSQVLSKDPFNEQCLPLHVAVLVELRKSNALFYLAHKLVDLYPTKAVAWFAVGCYYLLVGKNDPARRFLRNSTGQIPLDVPLHVFTDGDHLFCDLIIKATTLERVYGPAWLAFGHSFAVENEHDQAMAAYFTAAQLMKGCHLPVLYIGLEYGLTNNTKLAQRFFSQALAIAPEDPFVLHEMGVIAFQNKEWEQAEQYFRNALDMIQAVSEEVLAEKWEPLLNNLAHTCRKLKKYEDALDYHRQALVLCPMNPSTLSAVGYVNVLMGNPAEAVDYFHQALGLRRDDTFSTTMLGHTIEELLSDMPPCEGVPDVLPPYTYEGKLDRSSVSDLETSQLSVSQLETSVNTENSSMAIDTDMEEG